MYMKNIFFNVVIKKQDYLIYNYKINKKDCTRILTNLFFD